MNRKRLPPLNSLRAFDAASRHMSFQKAAEELAVTPSALSFQIRQLEEHLQIQLFERHNRSVTLSEAGRRLAPGIQDAFQQLGRAMEQLTPSTPPNVLTVSTGPAFAAKWLSPRIHRFIEGNPGLEFRISANLKLVDLREDGVDAVIRFGAGDYPGLFVEAFAGERTMPMIAPRVLERFGDTFGEDEVMSLTLLHDDSAAFLPQAVTWPVWARAAGFERLDTRSGARFNHADHALDAAIDGAGIVLGRLTLAARDIGAGRLVVPFDLSMQSGAGFYFCCLPEMLETPKVAAFRRFIREEMEREDPVLQRYRTSRG